MMCVLKKSYVYFTEFEKCLELRKYLFNANKVISKQ